MITILAIPACSIGKSGKDLAFATQPGGAMVGVLSSGGLLRGELVAVRDDGVVITSQKQLSFFPFASLGGLTVTGMKSDYQLSRGETPSREKLERLRLVSHFPQGLTPEIESRLLAQFGQTAIVTVR
ncbi:MAG: hypothetical protein ABIR58_06415 [Gemmatimonadaceae bacterium]